MNVRAKDEFTWPVRVYYEDTDAGGVVYYANYLRYLERARTEWLRAVGFEQDDLRDTHGVIFPVRRVALEYLRPARFNVELTVSVQLETLRNASLELAQVVRDSDQNELVTATVTIACVDAESFAARRLPAALLTELQRGS